jgi:hypothetical protein
MEETASMATLADEPGAEVASPPSDAAPAEPVGAAAGGGGNWFSRHKAISIIGGVIILLLVIGGIGSAMSPTKDTASGSSSPTPSASPSSSTPTASNSPSVSDTQTPSDTPTPSAPALKAVYSGVGDKIVKLTGPAATDPVVVTLTHVGSANFIVSPLDASGQDAGSMVNAIGNYSGTVPLNFESGSSTPAIKIQADGRWTMTIRSSDQVFQWDGSKPLVGKGDNVVSVVGAIDSSGLNTVNITHKGQANFIVDVWGSSSGSTNLVNEIGNYAGQQVLPQDGLLLVVQADGAWTVAKG